MNKLCYFYRAFDFGYSIERVSATYINELKKTETLVEFYVPTKKMSVAAIWENWRYVRKKRNKNGINHITGGIYYLAPAFSGSHLVLTYHDLTPFVNGTIWTKPVFYVFWFLLPMIVADKIVCISEFTKMGLQKLVPCISKSKFYVIPNAVDPSFYYHEKSFNTKQPIILIIGTGENKNLQRTIDALHGIPCHLRIIGPLSEKLTRCLNKNDYDYSNAENLTDEAILNEYKSCDIVSFASIYEGFGMPILEAQATGRVVLTSDMSPMKEVAGSGALLVNPFSREEIRAGFQKIITDEKLRNTLIANGLENVLQYTAGYVAEQYKKMYTSIL